MDDAETKDDLVALIDTVQADIKKCIAELESSFSANNLPLATEQFIYLRYLLSIENNIKEKANRIGHFLWTHAWKKGIFGYFRQYFNRRMKIKIEKLMKKNEKWMKIELKWIKMNKTPKDLDKNVVKLESLEQSRYVRGEKVFRWFVVPYLHFSTSSIKNWWSYSISVKLIMDKWLRRRLLRLQCDSQRNDVFSCA